MTVLLGYIKNEIKTLIKLSGHLDIAKSSSQRNLRAPSLEPNFAFQIKRFDCSFPLMLKLEDIPTLCKSHVSIMPQCLKKESVQRSELKLPRAYLKFWGTLVLSCLHIARSFELQTCLCTFVALDAKARQCAKHLILMFNARFREKSAAVPASDSQLLPLYLPFAPRGTLRVALARHMLQRITKTKRQTGMGSLNICRAIKLASSVLASALSFNRRPLTFNFIQPICSVCPFISCYYSSLYFKLPC